MEIIEVNIKEVKPYPNNPRINANAVDKVAESIRAFGFQQPIVVDRDNVIIVGHTRLEAAKKLKLKEVPVIVADSLSDEEARAYRLADNKTNEFSLWDTDLLISELGDIDNIDMELFGFELDGMDLDDGEVTEDNVPEIPKEPKAKPGDLYILGNHRLICADCTDVDAISRLMDGEKADMVFTDPPYGVSIGDKNKLLNENTGDGKGNRVGTNIQNDTLSEDDLKDMLRDAFVTMQTACDEKCSYYVASPEGCGLGMMMMMMMMDEAGLPARHTIIWEKSQQTFSMGRLDYEYKHEPILYTWGKGGHNFYGNGECKNSIWKFDKPRESKLHPTMKPVALVAEAIKNSSKRGDNVLDIFGGSGTTLIAAEQLGRRAFLSEIDPHYIDVIIERWENLTGQKAVLLNEEDEKITA